MIVGGHVMIQSRDDAADKAFFRDVLGIPSVDAGNGFLIFALPPSEFAVHEADANGAHEFFLMCEDMDDFVAAMRAAGTEFTAPVNRGWGTITAITLPGGGKLSVYQAHHARPHKTAKAAPKREAKNKVAKPAKRKAKAKKNQTKSRRR